MSKLQVALHKTLKLTNVLICKLPSGTLDTGIPVMVQRMENYIKSKGYSPLGPLIQKAEVINGEDIQISFLRQASGYIKNCDKTYEMESVLRVRNCFYTRYIGTKEHLDIAYDKLRVVAFEEDYSLTGDSYTIFLNEENGNITVDVFMPYAE